MSGTLTFAGYGAGPVYRDLDIWLPLLMHEIAQTGVFSLDGKTFINCRLNGPAVIVPVFGCQFNNCNMGAPEGDMRNLMFQPLGPTRITGAIAFRDCVFEGCEFIGIGYTGVPEFLEQLGAIEGEGTNGAPA